MALKNYVRNLELRLEGVGGGWYGCGGSGGRYLFCIQNFEDSSKSMGKESELAINEIVEMLI